MDKEIKFMLWWLLAVAIGILILLIPMLLGFWMWQTIIVFGLLALVVTVGIIIYASRFYE